MNSKIKFFTCILCSFFIILCMAFFLFVTDVLQIFEKSYFDYSKMCFDMRKQARGIINNVEFDSIIIGTSVLENSSAIQAGQILGGNFVNLSVSGSNFFERSLIIDFLFRKKNIKNVIYSFDYNYLDCATKRQDMDMNWMYLYDKNYFNDLLIYYDKKIIFDAIKNLFKKRKIDIANAAKFDRPLAWYNDEYENCRFGGLQNWVDNLEKKGVGKFLIKELPNSAYSFKETPVSEYIIDPLQKNNSIIYIDNYFLKFVKENPSTHFIVIFPPYYRYTFAVWRRLYPKYFYLHQDIIRYMVYKSAEYKNLKIFGYEDQSFLDQIENYKDTVHYHPSINAMFFDSIHNNLNLLTINNVEEYLYKSNLCALNFDIEQLNNRVIFLLKKYDDNVISKYR